MSIRNTTQVEIGMICLSLFFSVNVWAEGLVNKESIAESADKRLLIIAMALPLIKKKVCSG